MTTKEVEFGNYARKLRKQMNLSLRQVVDLSNGLLDKTTVSRIENGKRGANLRVLYAFSKVYQVPINEMIELIVDNDIKEKEPPLRLSSNEVTLVNNYRSLPRETRGILCEVATAMSYMHVNGNGNMLPTAD